MADYTTTSHEEFSSIALDATGPPSYDDYTDALTGPTNGAQIDFTGAAETGDAIELTKDFVTANSIPSDAVFTNISFRAKWSAGTSTGSGGLDMHYCLDGTKTANIISTDLDEFPVAERWFTPSYYGGVDDEWGITQAQALAFLDGTNPLWFQPRYAGGILATVLIYYVTAQITYYVPGEPGSILLGSF